MTFYRTVQQSAIWTDLTGLRIACACSFDNHSPDMDLEQTNSHYHPTSILVGKDMR